MITYTDNSTEGVYTLAEFMEATGQPARCAANADMLAGHLSRTGLDWLGIKDEAQEGETSYQTTARLVRDGWRRGVELMQEVESQVTVPTPRAVRRVQRWMAQGDDIEMQRVWNGAIDVAWRGTYRDVRSGPQRVRLLIDAIEPGGGGADQMRWRGVAALKLADALTEAGYSVQVESVISCADSSNERKKFKLRCIVKAYTDPVDLLTMAATSVLPAFFRSIVHAWGLASAKYYRSWGVSYQVPKETPVGDFADPQDDAPMFIISRKVNSAAKACEAVAGIVSKLEAEGE